METDRTKKDRKTTKDKKTENKVKQTKSSSKTNSNNKKSNTKFFIGILVILCIILAFAMLKLFDITKKEDDTQVPEVIEHSQEYETIMNMDFQNNYPTGYLEVIEANNEIVMYEYGEEIQLGEGEEILTKQRELFAEELKELNPIEAQLANYIEDVTNYSGMGRYIASRKILTSEILSYDGKAAQVLVDEVFNDGLVVQYTYYLVKEGDDWKIFSWERRVVKSADNNDTEEIGAE